MNAEAEFYEIITDLVDYYQRHNQWERKDVAVTLGISESYVRKIHSRGSAKRYSIKHLYLLARKWNICISKLTPSQENLVLLERYRNLNLKDRKTVIKNFELYLNLREEDLYE